MTQLGSQVTLPEKAAVTINCTYSVTRYPTVFWYVRYSREGPQILLKVTKDKEKGISKSLKPHTTENQNPSTWRKPQSKSQTRLCTTVLWVAQRRELQGELNTLWAAAGPGGWASDYLIHSVAQTMVFCLSVSGWYRTHTNDEDIRIRSEYSPYPTLISEFNKRVWHQ